MEDGTIRFLWDASLRCQELPSFKREAEAMMIHLRSRCIEEHKINSFALPEREFSSKTMCSGCHTLWSCGKFKLRLIPSKPLKKRMKRLISKEPSRLNNYQRKLRELCMKPRKNKLELKCLICERTTKIGLIKPKVESKTNENESLESSFSIKKKKKRKRDSFAGLNASAVQIVQDLLERTGSSLKSKKQKRLERKSLSDELNISGTLNETIEELNPKMNKPSETSFESNIQDLTCSDGDYFLESNKGKKQSWQDSPVNVTPNIKKERNKPLKNKFNLPNVSDVIKDIGLSSQMSMKSESSSHIQRSERSSYDLSNSIKKNLTFIEFEKTGKGINERVNVSSVETIGNTNNLSLWHKKTKESIINNFFEVNELQSNSPKKKQNEKAPENLSTNFNSSQASESQNSTQHTPNSDPKIAHSTPIQDPNSLYSPAVSTSKKKNKKKKNKNSQSPHAIKGMTPSLQQKVKHLINTVDEIRPKRNSLMAEFLNSL